MADDEEVDEELLELLRKSLAGGLTNDAPAKSLVLEDAEFVYDNSIDVAIDMASTKAAADSIYAKMQEQSFSCQTWSKHELHPQAKDAATVDFIFTMDLLNFSFWHDHPDEKPFMIDYHDKEWTGYWSLLAVLWRALDEDIPIITPSFWCNQDECTDELLKNVFRSSSEAPIPLLDERISLLREAGSVLCNEFDGTFRKCIEEGNHSALELVHLLTTKFPGFQDETRFEGQTVRFYKRAQILVADLWACFEGSEFGKFDDVDKITMFPDYRVPQMLHTMGCIQYSPPLDNHIKSLRPLEPGHTWEVQLRGCSVWAVELIRRQILKQHPEAEVSAILIDFFLYDTAKDKEKEGVEMVPHHRCRTIWY